jgi:hypothetical protein
MNSVDEGSQFISEFARGNNLPLGHDLTSETLRHAFREAPEGEFAQSVEFALSAVVSHRLHPDLPFFNRAERLLRVTNPFTPDAEADCNRGVRADYVRLLGMGLGPGEDPDGKIRLGEPVDPGETGPLGSLHPAEG